jgi:hypothetical protein
VKADTAKWLRHQVIDFAIFLVMLGIACGISPEKHAANVAESAGYAAELGECRRLAREAKKDGGAEAYTLTYEQCAASADAKHGVTFSDGGAP